MNYEKPLFELQHGMSFTSDIRKHFNNWAGAGNGVFSISDDGTSSGGTSTLRFQIDENGNVGIGTPASTGTKLEVHISEVDSSAILGKNAQTGAVWGVGGNFEVAADTGYGVFAEATATGAVTNYGIYGVARGDTGIGVMGFGGASGAVASTGVYGIGGGTIGIGVHAKAESSSGENYGLFARTESSTGWSGYFKGGQGVYIENALTVNGSIKLDNGIADGPGIVFESSVHTNQWEIDNSNGRFRIFEVGGAEEVFSMLNTSGNIGIKTPAPSAELEVNGYTMFGSDAPKIKMKKLTGTTNASEGGTVAIAHGLTGAKIIGFQILVEHNPNSGILPSHTETAEFEYNAWFNATDFSVENIAGNSGSILSKPIKILVTYEE